jgi:hypothetical protein
VRASKFHLYEENKEKLKLKRMERYWKQKKENEKRIE